MKFTSIFHKIRDKLTQDLTEMIYFTFVHSMLCYGIDMYGYTYTRHLWCRYFHQEVWLIATLLRQIEKPRQTHNMDSRNAYSEQ